MQHIFGGFFQVGYATRDLDAAMAAYRRKFGAVEFLAYEPGIINGAPSPTRRIALAYLDDTMIEIIEPDPAQQTIFDQAVPREAGSIGFHHFGYLIGDHRAMLARLQELGYAIPMEGSLKASWPTAMPTRGRTSGISRNSSGWTRPAATSSPACRAPARADFGGTWPRQVRFPNKEGRLR